jgi:hypothetical protein
MNPYESPSEIPARPADPAVGWSITPQSLVCVAAFSTVALAFWLPSVVIHFLRRGDYGVFDVLLTSVACPAAAGTVFTVLCLLKWKRSVTWRALMSLLGVWISGPPSMMVSATFSGGGLHTLKNPGEFLSLWAFFVVSTPMMATYDSSLVALLIITGMLLAVAVISPIIRLLRS